MYGWPKAEEKFKTWELMTILEARSPLPTVMFSYFIEILSMTEKERVAVRQERILDALRGALDSCSLRDLGFKGTVFTWEHGNSMETLVRKRLNRYLADDEWVSLFPCFEVLHFPIYHSDHAPIMLKCGKENDEKRGEKYSGFKYCGSSMRSVGGLCLMLGVRTGGDRIISRIARVEGNLTSWAADTFGG